MKIFIPAIFLINSLLISNFAYSAEENNNCIQHSSFRRGNDIVINTVNNCGKTKDVNVCLHIQDNLTIDNNSIRLEDREQKEVRFIDSNNKNYTYGVRWCDAGKSNYSATCPATCERMEPSSPPESVIKNLVIDFYKNKGEWAGTFYIGNIEKIRLDKVSQSTIIAHVRYLYIPVPGNRSGRTDTGYDQRVFTLSKTSQGWEVVSMGGHMSGML